MWELMEVMSFLPKDFKVLGGKLGECTIFNYVFEEELGVVVEAFEVSRNR